VPIACDDDCGVIVLQNANVCETVFEGMNVCETVFESEGVCESIPFMF
jgi:hypothetical protein